MIPLYDGQENHYKKMLDLHEKLRRSEEERIRLEERFNLMAQESRNRHTACINKLRICYVEFLEQQQLREERNNKLRGSLDKIDCGLIAITAKTERLNILRKQYEDYLLRTYGSQGANRSVTADSGLESQNEQEISPSPVFSKAALTVSKNLFPPANRDYPRSNCKVSPGLDNANGQKCDLLQYVPEAGRRAKDEQPESAVPAAQFKDSCDGSTKDSLLPSYADHLWRYESAPKADARAKERDHKFTSRKAPPAAASSSAEHDLDSYIGNIKRLHEDLLRADDRVLEPSLEEADHEQNTSGDLLNVTWSEKGLSSSSDDEWKKARGKLCTLRSLGRSGSTKIKSSEGARDSWAATLERFSQPHVSASSRRMPAEQEQVQWPSEDSAATELNFDKVRRLIKKNRSLIASEPSPSRDAQEIEIPEEAIEAPEEDEPEDEDDEEEDEPKDGDDDGCIEDDYDHTVDIDSWMPDDSEQQPRETQLHGKIRDICRRKLESIEEIDQPEEEEATGIDPTNAEQIQGPKAHLMHENGSGGRVKDATREDSRDLSEEITVFKAESVSGDEANDYAQDNNEQARHRSDLEYAQSYGPRDNADVQVQYENSDDQNQEGAYGVDARCIGYDDRRYPDAQHGCFIDEQYEPYEPSQRYNPDQEYVPSQQSDPEELCDPSQSYDASRHYASSQRRGNAKQERDPNRVHETYEIDRANPEDNLEFEQESTFVEGCRSIKDSQAEGDYSGEAQPCPEVGSPQNSLAAKSANETSPINQVSGSKDRQASAADSRSEASSKDQGRGRESFDQETSSSGAQLPRSTAKAKKKRRDVIRSILDSDSESFIERNLSNTESDYDFN